MDSKECDICHRILPLEAFNNNVARLDGKQTTCRECQHRRYMANTPNKRKRLELYPLDELINEIKKRGETDALLDNMDQEYIVDYVTRAQQPTARRLNAEAEYGRLTN